MEKKTRLAGNQTKKVSLLELEHLQLRSEGSRWDDGREFELSRKSASSSSVLEKRADVNNSLIEEARLSVTKLRSG